MRKIAEAKRNNCLYRFFFFLLFLLMFLPSANAGLLEDIFSPLTDLDIPTFYSQYSTIIDMGIFLLIFLGLAQVTLGKRFGDSRGAKAITVGVGIALSLALVLMEEKMGFSIAQFGPYAAAIFVILVATLLFHLLRTLGIGGVSSFSASFVIVYFLLRSVVPNFFSYLEVNAPSLHALIALGALLSLIAMLWQIGSHFSPGHMEKISARIEEIPGQVLKKGKAAAGLALEHRMLKSRLAEIQKQRSKDSEAIIGDLDNIVVAIDKYGDTSSNRHLIAQTLSRDVIPREHKLRRSLRALKKLFEQVEKLEMGMLAQIKNLPPAERKAAKEEIKTELQKLNIEERLKDITIKIQEYDKVFRDRIKQAVREINADKMDQARAMILEARESEDKIRELDEEINELSKVLRGLTSREIAGGKE